MLQRFASFLSVAGMIATLACAQSDPGITTAVKTRLVADDSVAAYQINIDTKDRVVTLTGTVDRAAAKERAMTIARQTEGVQGVVDHITVSPQATATTGELKTEGRELARDAREQARETKEAAKELGHETQDKVGDAAVKTGAALTDAAITSAVKSRFLVDSAVSGLKIDVDTSNGVVTLNGTVSSQAESARAVSLARETSGVKRVVNNLRMRG